MKTSEKCYGAAISIILIIAALADSPNTWLWTALATLGLVAAGALIRIAVVAERKGK